MNSIPAAHTVLAVETIGQLMELSRREFLKCGVAGLLTAAAGCSPPHFELALAREGDLLEAKRRLGPFRKRLLGYPTNMNLPPEGFLAWREKLREVGVGIFHYNNVGNPYRHGPIPFNTHDFERQTIERFAPLYGFPPDDLWGFISHSGTDSNMHGMYIGRTLLEGRTGRRPRCYFTREAHYSIQILTDLLGLERVFVETLPDASMDPEDLDRKLQEGRDRPALVVATAGTTFKGAIDRLDLIGDVLADHPQPHYIHLDAALFGGYLIHTPYRGEVWHGEGRYHSLAVSCHKFFGFYAPAGIFITRRSTFEAFNELFSRVHSPEYIGHVPGTITCSRDAVKPAEFWFYSSPEAFERQREEAGQMLEITEYLYRQMAAHLPHLRPRREHHASNTIWFKKPPDWIVEKYTLATMTVGGEPCAHAVIMPHVDREVADEFLDDLSRG